MDGEKKILKKGGAGKLGQGVGVLKWGGGWNPFMNYEPLQPVQMNIYQSNTYIKDLTLLHFNNEPRVQER